METKLVSKDVNYDIIIWFLLCVSLVTYVLQKTLTRTFREKVNITDDSSC